LCIEGTASPLYPRRTDQNLQRLYAAKKAA
jgi:hypothetical protein